MWACIYHQSILHVLIVALFIGDRCGKKKQATKFCQLIWQKEVTAITMADGSNYLIVLAGYVTSLMTERSRIVSQSQMMLYLGQPISTNVFWWRYTVFVRCACVCVCVCVCVSVCLSVCVCAAELRVNQTTLKQLILRMSNLTRTFPGTVRTWSLKNFSKNGRGQGHVTP